MGLREDFQRIFYFQRFGNIRDEIQKGFRVWSSTSGQVLTRKIHQVVLASINETILWFSKNTQKCLISTKISSGLWAFWNFCSYFEVSLVFPPPKCLSSDYKYHLGYRKFALIVPYSICLCQPLFDVCQFWMRLVEASMAALKEILCFQLQMRKPGFLNHFCLLAFWLQTQVAGRNWNITTVGCVVIFWLALSQPPHLLFIAWNKATRKMIDVLDVG